MTPAVTRYRPPPAAVTVQSVDVPITIPGGVAGRVLRVSWTYAAPWYSMAAGATSARRALRIVERKDDERCRLRLVDGGDIGGLAAHRGALDLDEDVFTY